MIIIGLMSGTSADGVDAAVVDIEDHGGVGPFDWRLLAHLNVPHPPELRAEILACCDRATGTVDRVCALSAELGEAFAAAALQAARAAGLPSERIDAIGSHGQTVWHIPAKATLQIGQPAVIAERTGVTTVSNFRSRDIAAGGQGAPLVAYVDALLFTHPAMSRALQNIGGIGNVTYLPPGRPAPDAALAFDTGPGNMLIDYATQRATAGAWTYDRDGVLASAGRVDGELIEELMDHAFIRQRPPKTTGREEFGIFFGERMWARAESRGLRPNDIVATMTAFTAISISQAYRDYLPAMPDEVILSGGGARNVTLARMIERELAGPRVLTSDQLGMSAEAKEAICFAVLAHQTLRGRPSNSPTATGARRPVVLGDITPGDGFPR